MITVYFAQHGLAESKEIDETRPRPLSESGINKTTQIANVLKNKHILITKIRHSGKLRAAQTASLFAQFLSVSDVSESTGLSPNDDPKILINQLSTDAVLYVGHLPNIQVVVSTLLSNGDNNRLIKFQNSSVACIEIENEMARLNWFLTSDLC